MEERIVQYSEHSDTREETETAVAPAPMVERAFRLLDLLSAAEEGLTLSDLARALNMSKGSIHGLLKTLEGNGVIEQAEDGRYVMGPRIYDLAQAYIQRAGLRHYAFPAMHLLAVRTGVSFDHEEYLVGVNAVGAPIYGTGGALVALLWVVGFASRFKDEALERAAQRLRAEVLAVSQALGARR